MLRSGVDALVKSVGVQNPHLDVDVKIWEGDFSELSDNVKFRVIFKRSQGRHMSSLWIKGWNEKIPLNYLPITIQKNYSIKISFRSKEFVYVNLVLLNSCADLQHSF
ncbi:hypothetical protein TNCT_627531 [Trichonephila clavata]|uniref:Uncharacterized protein n=1 Tax=Trichonephila clavata TaxID=2740835 RepID=A0A8X6KYC8_TRICU|nr:hypothetical protein TNCT_627531 [Trichonephila clavata]